MNLVQKIILAVGLIYVCFTLLLPPVIVPPAALTGATRSFVEFVPWSSQVAHVEGIFWRYFVSELLIIFLLTAGGMYLSWNRRIMQ